jgi:hypothetical protein
MMSKVMISCAVSVAAVKVQDDDKTNKAPNPKGFKALGQAAVTGAVAASMMGSANAFGDTDEDWRNNPCNSQGPDVKQSIWTDLADLPCFDPQAANEIRPGTFEIGGPTALSINGVQSGADVTEGNRGDLASPLDAISTRYTDTCTDGFGCMCAVNAHWHLGAEHYNEGTYDLNGEDWIYEYGSDDHRRALKEGRKLAGDIQPGNWCPGYDREDPAYTDEYDWQYCTDMHVGYTYEIHWPHSNLGACDTEWQMQTHFMDGVLCLANQAELDTDVALDAVFNSEQAKIGVQAQVFTIVNDEAYSYPEWEALWSWNTDLATNVAVYQGSTTGLNDGNIICRGTGGAVTWQVDRGCHKISASKFDDLCREMLDQRDDMSGDVYPHTARDTVLNELVDDSVMERHDFSYNP